MFDHVFKPIMIGSMGIKNRLARSAGATNYANLDGTATPLLWEFYAEEAKGGVGLIVVETSYVDEIGAKGLQRELALSRDDCLPGLTRLAQVIKENGARAGIQLGHLGGGRACGEPIVAPSPLPYQTTMGLQTPRELTIGEIKKMRMRLAWLLLGRRRLALRLSRFTLAMSTCWASSSHQFSISALMTMVAALRSGSVFPWRFMKTCDAGWVRISLFV